MYPHPQKSNDYINRRVAPAPKRNRDCVNPYYACQKINRDSAVTLDTVRDYYNPYETNIHQDIHPPLYMREYRHCNDLPQNFPLGKIATEHNIYREYFPGDIRNVNVESQLMQEQTTKIRGQRKISEIDYDRFNLLPFDPQDPRHIVWTDMPRGGFSTRNDKIELN